MIYVLRKWNIELVDREKWVMPIIVEFFLYLYYNNYLKTRGRGIKEEACVDADLLIPSDKFQEYVYFIDRYTHTVVLSY